MALGSRLCHPALQSTLLLYDARTMRPVLFATALAAAVSAGCTTTVAGPEERYPFLIHAVGTVVSLDINGGEPYIIEVEAPRPMRVGPDLPDLFRREGVRVVFSGTFLPIDPAVRYAALPFKLTRIERAR